MNEKLTGSKLMGLFFVIQNELNELAGKVMNRLQLSVVTNQCILEKHTLACIA